MECLTDIKGTVMIDIDKHIDNYIHEEKAIAPSPFLQSRIMAKLKERNNTQKATLWYSTGIAASIVAVIISGFMLGSSYNKFSDAGSYTIVDDNQIENLLMMTDDGNE